MGEIIKAFGLDFVPFLAQVVIVLIVYAVLNKFAFGPVMAMLEERRLRIEAGEKNLEKIRADMAQSEEKVREMLDRANVDAARLVSEARESADAVREQKTQEAVVEAGHIIAKAKEASKLEHERMMNDLRRDFGRLVVEATGKVTGKVLTEDDQTRINEETAGQIAL